LGSSSSKAGECWLIIPLLTLHLLNPMILKAKDIAIGIAVTAFYALDFALNA
jgi:hypothetical protein